jgi:hypothetical protein
MVQVGWVLHHLDDLASDFSAIHGIRDMTVLDCRSFFALAHRLTAYRGVLRERALREAAEDAGQAPAPPAAAPERATVSAARGLAAAPAPSRGATVVPSTKLALQNEPGFPGVFSFGTMAKQR